MKFLQAVLILSGLIIGAGMFGIPYAFSAVGFWLGTAELIVLTGVILWLHFLYGEIVLATPDVHRLPGYARLYLGARAAAVSHASAILGITGSLLAYIILGSLFLGNIAGHFSFDLNAFAGATVFVIVGGLTIYFPVRHEAIINGVLTAALIVFIVFLTVLLIPRADTGNFSGWQPANILLPYGVLLFALAGGTAIPDVVSFLGRERGPARRAIAIGTLLPALLYFFFAFAVIGVTGDSVSSEAIEGLRATTGNTVVLIGSIIGFLAVFTSYIVLGMSYEALLRLDLGRSALVAWAGAAAVPFVLYILGFQNFIAVIGLVGALGVGVDSALLVASYRAMRRRAGHPLSFVSSAAEAGFYAMILAGVIYEAGFFFSLW